MPHPNYLCRHRKRSGLSQRELGELIGVSRSVISRSERDVRLTGVEQALALEVVFGVPVREIFAGLYSQIEEVVMRKGAELDGILRGKVDAMSICKLQALDAMMQRAVNRAGA